MPAATAAKLPAASKKNGPTAADPQSSPTVPPAAPLPNESPTGSAPVQAPPAAQPVVPITDQTAPALWKQVIDRLTAANELVADQAALFERLATSAPNSLVVSFAAKYNSCKSFCEQPEQRAKLENALAEMTGETVRLAFELVETDSAETDSPPQGRSPTRREIQAEVVGRSFVRRAMELFDVTDCRIDPPDASS